tara:strand:- start:2771 stop:3031 length:261 start_codon:yes stop_codon:yes gene_type:complete
MSNNEKPGMTEQAYLELAEDSKVTFDRMERENERLRKSFEDVKHELITSYGMIRMIDNLYSELENRDTNVELLIDIFRTYLSQYVD